MLPIDRATFERELAALPEGLQRRAASGWDAFETLAMPTEKDEDWRYVHPNLDLADRGFVSEPGAALPASPLAGVLEPSATATNVDGRTLDASSGDRVTVTPLRQSESGGEPPPIEDRIVALHEAFARDGVVVEVARGSVVSAPVFIDMQVVTGASVSAPRVRVVAGDSSDVAVIVHQRSPDGLDALVVPRFEVVTGSAARVHLTVVQEWGDATIAAARHHHTVGRDASFVLAEAGFGGDYSRLHLSVDLIGDGSSAGVVGAYFGEAEQTLDYRYFMRHAARGTTSDMFLKGAVAGESRSVFTGLIRIEKEGQKTSAHQTNRNLVLSDGAEAHSVPNLEILADDVRCGHGSAVGPLDEEQRYYLMSRGLDRDHADRLQVKGFFEEALLRFPDQRLEPALRAAAMAKYTAVMP